jgi:hypothetical protein
MPAFVTPSARARDEQGVVDALNQRFADDAGSGRRGTPKVLNMPFTLTHVAAILPIAAAAPRALPFSALVIGSMIPDFPLFVPLPPTYATTHSISGIFVACVPLGLVCFLAFQCLMKRPFLALLPDAIRGRFAAWANPIVEPTFSFFASSSLAIAIGAATHVFWDSFTHRGRWGSMLFPWLNERVLTIAGQDVAGHKALQYGSTLVFLPLIVLLFGYWLIRQRPQPLAGLPALPGHWRAAVYMIALAIPVGTTLIVWTGKRLTPYMKLGRSITMSGFVVGLFLLIYCVGYHIAFRRASWRQA